MRILAEMFGLISGICCTISGLQKSHKNIMKFQVIDCSAAIVSGVPLKGYAGVIITGLALIRNMLSYKKKFNKTICGIIIALQIVLTFLFVDLSNLPNWIPLVASISYTYGVYFGSCKITKIYMLINLILWGVYYFYIKSYMLFAFGIISIVGVLITLNNKEGYNGKFLIRGRKITR